MSDRISVCGEPISKMALDQFVNTVKTLSSQRSLTELCDFLNKQVTRVII